MAGLLNNLSADPMFNVGMGLLSQGPSPYKINPWQGVQGGLLSAQRGQALQQRQAQQEQMMQMQQQEMQMRQQQAQQQEVDRRIAAARDAAARDYLAQNNPEAAARIIDPKGLALEQYKTKNAPVEAENWIVMPDGTQHLVNDAEARQLLAQGGEKYKAPPSTVVNNMSGNDRVTVAEAKDLRYPDGSSVAPGTTWEEASARGATILTAGDKAVEQINAKESAATEKAAGPVRDYAKSVENWRKNKGDATSWATVQQERRRLAQSLAQTRNPGRAPTDADVEVAMQDIPLPVSGMDMAASFGGGGDPWAARMEVVGKELGVALPKQEAETEPAPPPPENLKRYQKYNIVMPPS